MSRSTLRTIIAGIIIMIFIAVGTAGAVALAQDSLRQQALTDNGERADAAGLAVERVLSANIENVRRFAVRTSFLRAAVSKKYTSLGSDLSTLVASNVTFSSAGYYSSDARLRARSPAAPKLLGFAFSKQDYFRRAASKGSYVSAMYHPAAEPKLLVVSFSVAVRSTAGKLVGVLVASAPIADLDRAFASTIPTTGSIQIFNHAGQRVSPAKSASVRSFQSNDTVARALSGSAGSRLGVVSGEGVQFISYAPAGADWAVVLERPQTAVAARSRSLRTRLIAIGAALALLTFLALVIAGAPPTPKSARARPAEPTP